MKPETYKIFNFAITQDNLELVQFILSQDQLSNEELIQSLNMAKAKPTILSILSQMIPPTEPQVSETNKETDWKVDDCYMIDKKKVGKNSRLIKEIMSIDNIDSNDILDGLAKNKYTLEEINHQNEGGWTAMMLLANKLAGIEFSEKCINAMINVGANINLKNNDGRSPLLISLKGGSYRIAEILLECSQLDVNEKYRTNEVSSSGYYGDRVEKTYVAEYTILHYLIGEATRSVYSKQEFKKIMMIVIHNEKIDMSIENHNGDNIVDYWCKKLSLRTTGYGESDIFQEVFEQILKNKTFKFVKMETLNYMFANDWQKDLIKIIESKKIAIKRKWSDIVKETKSDKTKKQQNINLFKYILEYYPEGLTIEP